MTSWPIGLSTGCFYHRSILDCLPLIRESGFSMIEVCSTPEHLNFRDLKLYIARRFKSESLAWKLIRSMRHLRPPSISPLLTPHNAPRPSRKSSRRRKRPRFCRSTISFFIRAGKSGDHLGFGTTAAHAACSRVVEPGGQHCQQLGIVCVLENKLPHLLFGNTSDILWILDGMNTVAVGVCLDTGHAFLGGDIHSLVHKLSGHLRMIHAHDNRGSDDDHLPPVDGKIDWEKFLHHLIEVRFRGAFILEMAGNNDPAVTMANARRGRSYLRDVARRLALAT